MMVILTTERLTLRSHQESDRDAYCEMMANAEFRTLSGGVPLNRKEAKISFDSILSQMPTDPNALHVWAIADRSSDLYIGRAGLYPVGNE